MKYYLLCIFTLLSFNIGIAKAQSPTIVPESPKQPLATQNNLFNRIGLCESNGDLHAKSRTSSASGEYQFIWSSWNHYGKELWGDEFYSKNIWSEDNRELAWYVFTKYGTSDWNASRSCWSKQ